MPYLRIVFRTEPAIVMIWRLRLRRLADETGSVPFDAPSCRRRAMATDSVDVLQSGIRRGSHLGTIHRTTMYILPTGLRPPFRTVDRIVHGPEQHLVSSISTCLQWVASGFDHRPRSLSTAATPRLVTAEPSWAWSFAPTSRSNDW